MNTNRYRENQYYHGKKELWQVLAYPLNDNVSPYSIGIHTIIVRRLNDKRLAPIRLSGFYFESKTYGNCDKPNCNKCECLPVCTRGRKLLRKN
ncbi:MAG: hypothetical protein PHG53_09470 [Phycisphaerae bacterium]|nr:hypothetical protein [Phycisphaerae bacterium]